MATDSRNVDYATKYKKELDQAFSEDSLTEKYVTQEESFKEDGGVASVYFRTVDTSDFLAGHTGPTFSAPDAVASDVVRKDVTLFYQINKVIASVSVDDTAGAMDAAGEILTTGIRERYAPFMDKLRMATAIAAANGYGGANVVAYNSADIMGGIDSMIATLKNNRSYSKTQALFIPASVEPELDTELFSIYAPNKNDSVINTGVIGKYKGIDVVVLPDELFATITATSGSAPYQQVTFATDSTIKAVLWDKRVIKNCRKLYQTFVLTGKAAITAGADGPVLRGLFRPGCWVLDANGTKKAVAILKDTASA